MPRSHVSIARFYDWSEDLGQCVSISKFYRDLSLPHNNDKMKGRGKQWCNGIHINPGRMFLRDKNGLTKGEREIIEGIYKNRGDMPRDEASPYVMKDDLNVVKSHKEAWLVGKQIPKNGLKIESPCDLRLPDYLFSKSTEPPDPISRMSSHNSNESKDSPSSSRNEKMELLPVKEREVPKAPPSSPKESQRKHSDNLKIHPKIPPINSGHGTVLIERVHQQPDVVKERKEMPANKKRLFMNVFLPKSTADMSRENSFLVLNNDKNNPLFTDDEQELYQARIDNMKFSRHRRDLVTSSFDVHRSVPHKTVSKSDNIS